MESEITKRWIDGPTATQAEWDAIDAILAARGWMSLSRECSRIRVAERNGKIIAFFVAQMVPYCGPVYVAPSERGTGLAGELGDEMFDFLNKTGARGWLIVAENPHVPAMCEARNMRKLHFPVYTTEVLKCQDS